MSTHREIEEVFLEDINKKSKMVKFTGDSLRDLEGELDQSSLYEESTYFILDSNSNAVKIGKTSQPVEDRMADIQYGNPNKLRIIAVIPREDVEKELHLKFRDYRIRGEWFRYTDELKSFIEELP